MAIKIIYGGPRSGKSYYCVNHISKTYFDEDKNGNFTLKEKYVNLKIVSNIEGLNIPHEDLTDWIRKAGGVNAFFANDFQEKVSRKYPHIVYFIDEAQMLFPDNFRDHAVFNYFQYHGHYGHDIFLLTQDVYLLPRKISVLAELTIYALPRSTSLFGGRELRYNVMLGKEVGDKIVMLKKQKIFNLYKSQDRTEVEKVTNPLIKYIVVCLVVFGCGAFYSLSHFAKKGKVEVKERPSAVSSGPGQQNSPDQASIKYSNRIEQTYSSAPAEPIHRIKLNWILIGKKLTFSYHGYRWTARDLPFEIAMGPYQTYYGLVPESVFAQLWPEGINTDRDRFSPGYGKDASLESYGESRQSEPYDGRTSEG